MSPLKASLFLLLFTACNTFASSQDEIDHLLGFVGETSCTYERNGTMHKGSEAVKHIKRKYNYFSDDIKTAEDFIKYSATKSTMSSKYYQVHCPDQPTIKSKDWLLSELKRYRAVAVNNEKN